MWINKRISVEFDEYVDVEIDSGDIKEYINDCDDEELEELRDYLSEHDEIEGEILEVNTLSDMDKYELVKDLYDNYSLEDIQSILNWKQGKGINPQ